jgi:hypothetical protein
MDNTQYIKNLVTSKPWRLAELIERGAATTHYGILCTVMYDNKNKAVYKCVLYFKTGFFVKIDRNFGTHCIKVADMLLAN